MRSQVPHPDIIRIKILRALSAMSGRHTIQGNIYNSADNNDNGTMDDFEDSAIERAIRSEHQRVTRELQFVRKFSPEWFRLKEELVALSVRLELEEKSAHQSPAGSDPLFVHDSDSSDGEDYGAPSEDPLDEHVTQLIDNQLLQFDTYPSADAFKQGTSAPNIPPSSQQVANSLIEDQLLFSADDSNKEDSFTGLAKRLTGRFNSSNENNNGRVGVQIKSSRGNNEFGFDDSDFDDFDGLGNIHSNHKPLEISSRRALGRRSSSSSNSFQDTEPWGGLLHTTHPDIGGFYDSSRKGSRLNRLLGVGRRSPRRVKIALALIITFVIVVSSAMMKNTSKSHNETLETDDSKDEADAKESTFGGDPEPNPPTFPNSMIIFQPPQSDAEIEEMRTTLQEYSDPIMTWEDHSGNEPKPDGYPDFTYTAENHFSSKRTALLFAPGTYPKLDFEIGYYTSVIGLGVKPSDVMFTACAKGPHVPATEKFTNRPPNGSGLDTFWRSIENVATGATEGMQWAVSQAAPMRRMHIQTDLNLYDQDSWVSGGVAANLVVDGKVNFGGQQQWLMRNVEFKNEPVNGAWSLVFVGCTGNVPEESDGMDDGPSISIEDKPRVRVEKPYIVMKTVGRSLVDRHAEQADQYQFELRVPKPTFGDDASGPQFEVGEEDIRDFRQVKLAVPSNSTNATAAAKENYSVLQKALNEGKDLVLSPGIYPLSHSLKVTTDDQVILGLGYATLVAPETGVPCIRVHSWVPGVRIAGIMLEASAGTGKTNNGETSSLLEWGTSYSQDPGNASNPGVLTDVYARVGGVSRDVTTDVMIRLYSGNVYGDNLWLWRADHVKLHPDEKPNFPDISLKYRQTQKGECEVKNGLVVGPGAQDVTMVGLAVEHTSEDQTIWMGNDGQVYFYQSELPYDADPSFAEKKFVGYKVGDKVTNHKAVGLGVYCNFRDHDIEAWTGVVHPPSDGIEMRNIFTVKLDNQGEISSVVNGHGPGPMDELERGHPYRCINNEVCSDEIHERDGTIRNLRP